MRRLQLLPYAALPVCIQLRSRYGAQCRDGIACGGVCAQRRADDKGDGCEQVCCSLDAHRAAFRAEQRFGILRQQGKTGAADSGSVAVGEIFIELACDNSNLFCSFVIPCVHGHWSVFRMVSGAQGGES